jgi:hypothetical protein
MTNITVHMSMVQTPPCRSFINHVEAQHGKKNKHITEGAAHQLIEDAEYILSQL